MSKPNSHEEKTAREAQWAEWMCAGLDGDGEAYRLLLEALAPVLRRITAQGLKRAGLGNADVEDVVQEILLAIHLKRHTWLRDQLFSPWLHAVARYKLIDAMRRRGRRGEVPIDDLIEVLPDEKPRVDRSPQELVKLVGQLNGREYEVVTAISLDGGTIGDAARKLGLSEGAVRVALHRGLKRLAHIHRDEDQS
jgi:RNA polymerase sigma-70 factor (ECF subfamily)